MTRDESRDVYVYDGETLGVTDYSHYLEHGDEWGLDGDRYVLHSDLESAERRSETHLAQQVFATRAWENRALAAERDRDEWMRATETQNAAWSRKCIELNNVRYELQEAIRERDEALDRVRELEAIAWQHDFDFGLERDAFILIRDTQEADIIRLQEYISTIEPLAKAYREIGETALAMRKHRGVTAWEEGLELLIDKAAELAKKE